MPLPTGGSFPAVITCGISPGQRANVLATPTSPSVTISPILKTTVRSIAQGQTVRSVVLPKLSDNIAPVQLSVCYRLARWH